MGLFYRSQHRILFSSFVVKAIFVVVEVALAIAFGACGRHLRTRNAAAILEWSMSLFSFCPLQFCSLLRILTATAIAFVFTGYILSFVVDLLPSVRTRRHVPQGEKRTGIEMSQADGDAPPQLNNAIIEEPLTMDSTGPAAGYYRGQRI